MTVLVGTQDGTYRSKSSAIGEFERVLDSGVTLDVQTVDGYGSFVASKTGLFRTQDGGDSWDRLKVPQTEVYSVAVSPDGRRLYVGTHPARLYVSTDEGTTWSELTGFRELPSRPQWHTPRHRGSSHVRSLGVHPDEPARLIAGVEVGGVHVSDDYGATWDERRDDLQHERVDDLQFDVHHVLVRTAEEFVISCGSGCYRTRDSGRTWGRFDVDLDRSYFQESIQHRGTLYTAAQTHPPTLPMGRSRAPREVDAALYESSDGGDTFDRVAYPGGRSEFVYAWTVSDGRVLAGTTDGRVIVRDPDGWTTRGKVPAWIRSLTVS